VRERLGNRAARSITREDIEALRDWMLTEGRKRGGKPGSGLGARSVRLTLGRLSAAFTLAIRDRRLSVNPCAYVALPAQERAERTTWSEGELRKFLAVADADRLAAAWRLALYGLRRGEVCGLRWDDVDFDAQTVTIGRARVVVGSQVIEKSPKSERGCRVLPLDDRLTTALRALRKQQASERLAAGKAYRTNGYVVCDELGAAVNPEWFSDEFHRVAASAGVPRIRLHDGRHTINSLMAAAGVPPHIRAAWCGHTEAVNERTYTHARPEDLAVAGAALSRIVGAV
jgi:integrase